MGRLPFLLENKHNNQLRYLVLMLKDTPILIKKLFPYYILNNHFKHKQVLQISLKYRRKLNKGVPLQLFFSDICAQNIISTYNEA